MMMAVEDAAGTRQMTVGVLAKVPKLHPRAFFFLFIVGSKFFMSTVGRKLRVPSLGFFLFNFYS